MRRNRRRWRWKWEVEGLRIIVRHAPEYGSTMTVSSVAAVRGRTEKRRRGVGLIGWETKWKLERIEGAAEYGIA